MPGLDFDTFDETDFEEFCFHLLDGLDGFHNADWRKGTPKPATPADRGRDIAAEVVRTDVDGARHVDTWFVDCKHYSKGVPPEVLQGLLAWAHAERPDVALVIASGYLSNAYKDYQQNSRPPFRIGEC
jgi:HJR/Mrr/RecB family endonuclease